MDRTIRVQLQPSNIQAAALHETLVQFTKAFNAACNKGWEMRTSNAYTIQHFVYRKNKNASPILIEVE